MAQSFTYQLGYAIGRSPTWLKAAVVLGLVAALFRCSTHDGIAVSTVSSKINTPHETAKAQADTPLKPTAKQVCEQNLSTQKQAYKMHVAAQQHWQAANSIRVCTGVLATEELKSMLRDAEIPSLQADIQNLKLSPKDRAQAMLMLARDYPDVGKKYEDEAHKLIAAEDKKNEKLAVYEALKHQKKYSGVYIGMTKEQVLESTWGKPERVNTTTTAYKVREQWVYGGHNNLYFENGVLVTIQN